MIYYSITDWNSDPWADPWINDAISSAEPHATIEIPAGTYSENMEVSEYKTLLLQGEWNCSHTSRNAGDTIIDGKLTVGDGRAIVEDLVIM